MTKTEYIIREKQLGPDKTLKVTVKNTLTKVAPTPQSNDKVEDNKVPVHNTGVTGTNLAIPTAIATISLATLIGVGIYLSKKKKK